MLISEEAIHLAKNRIGHYLPATPLIRSDYYSQITGCNVHLKLEISQPTHAFKVRGAFNAVAEIPIHKRLNGVVTASGGNHGLGVALACQKLQAPCTVFLPTATPKVKVEAIEKLGAEIVLFGACWDEANAEAIAFAQNKHLSYIHPFADEAVMAGQGTILVELLQQLSKPPDLFICSVGGGGLICGNISAARHFSPHTRFVGVETEGANCMSASLAAGELVKLPGLTSTAESLGACQTTQRQLDIVAQYTQQMVTVNDEAAIASLLELLSQEKLLVEPACSCTLAALTSGKIKTIPGETIVVVLCGGNISLDKVCQWQKERKI